MEPSGRTSSCSFWHFCSLSHSTPPCFGPHARGWGGIYGRFVRNKQKLTVWRSAWRHPSQIAFVKALLDSFLGLVVNSSLLLMQRLPETPSCGRTPRNFHCGPSGNQLIQLKRLNTISIILWSIRGSFFHYISMFCLSLPAEPFLHRECTDSMFTFPTTSEKTQLNLYLSYFWGNGQFEIELKRKPGIHWRTNDMQVKYNLLIPSDDELRFSQVRKLRFDFDKRMCESRHNSNVWLWTTRLHSRQSCKWCLHQNTVNLHLYFSSFSVPSCGHVGVGDVGDILLCFWQTATFFTWEIIFLT